MVDMFKNYPQPDDYIPNNYPRCHCRKPLEIMAGETAIHSFDVPFNVEDETTMCEVIYQLGTEPIIIKNSMLHLDIVVLENNTSIVTCTLKPNETALFKNTTLDTRVQLKFYMDNGNITYSEIYKVSVKDSLDVNNRKDANKPGMIAGLPGYGYTED